MVGIIFSSKQAKWKLLCIETQSQKEKLFIKWAEEKIEIFQYE